MTTSFDSSSSLTAIAALYLADEDLCLRRLIPLAQLNHGARQKVATRASDWIEKIRINHKPALTVSDMMATFGLTTQEGLALMCLAEALLRIPDRATADALIHDKLQSAEWDKAISDDTPWAMNITAWGLMLTGSVLHLDKPETAGGALSRLVGRLGQPVIRGALRTAMQWMANQFVMGETINEALERAAPHMRDGVRYSFDMLGEGARSSHDAARYLRDYELAIDAIGTYQAQNLFERPSGISVKLSALHPRYEIMQRERVLRELPPILAQLCERAAKFGMTVTIDAEEAERLHLSMEVADELMRIMNTGSWQGLGFAVQAYDKRAEAVITHLAGLAATHKRHIHVRLVKGAYWDSEIKRAQERGLADFPVYTRKTNTDVSYLACARHLLNQGEWIAPVFGTHNALTVAHIAEVAGDALPRVEFQRLQGMGQELHDQMRDEDFHTCIYAPVGSHDVLLGYLVRRILENGANSSFVHQMLDKSIKVPDLVADPVSECLAQKTIRHPAVTLPLAMFAPQRRNSNGLNLYDPFVTESLTKDMAAFSLPHEIEGDTGSVDELFTRSRKGFESWSQLGIETRALCLDKLADALGENLIPLMALLVGEGGKTIPDALGEVREAVDFCRYYAARSRLDFVPLDLPGPTGEHNCLRMVGRGVFICISPWNFPLAIFLGQVAAALVAGNAVIAKPAQQTPRIALFVARLAYSCGVPEDVLRVVTGGADIGAALVAASTVAGVAFTGSTAAARAINRSLAAKEGPIVPLIAETGGQNALIVDNSALVEQVVDDVINSAFRSAGQRCSALRLLCLPAETAQKTIAMLKGAMAELRVGDPALVSTDVGPVIDQAAQLRLSAHIARLRREAKELFTAPIAAVNGTDGQHFVAPQAWEIPDIAFLTGEVFGPILHIVRYKTEELTQLIDRINATGFGLTGGIHSRVVSTVARVERELAVGNFYVNRSLIGAVVGAQPFGGEGLSGTGPKAGGPHYLLRFATERVTSVNTTAAGGNASLLMAAALK